MATSSVGRVAHHAQQKAAQGRVKAAIKAKSTGKAGRRRMNPAK